MSDKPYWMVRRDMKLGQKPKTDASGAPEGQESPEKPKPGGPAKKETTAPNRPKSPKKKIKARSKKRAKQERQYRPVRRKFLEANAVCQLKYDGCTTIATEIHHAAGRQGAKLLDLADFKAACRSCHQKAENNPKMAKKTGGSKSRLSK